MEKIQRIKAPPSFPKKKKDYEFKEKLLEKKPVDEADFKELCWALSEKGRRLSGIVRRNLRDIEDKTGKEIEL